jgi:hypothetical protein
MLSPTQPTDKPVAMDSGAPTVAKVILTIGVLTIFALMTPRGAVGLLQEAIASKTFEAWTRFSLGTVILVPLTGIVLLRIWRAGSWIEGTRLYVRTWRKRSIDLAAVRSIKVDWVKGRKGRLVPALNVVTAEGDPKTVLLTVDRGRPLAPEQVHALIAAIAVGSRPGPHGDAIRKVIEELNAIGRSDGRFRAVIQ